MGPSLAGSLAAATTRLYPDSVGWVLSVPVLVILAWAMVGLVWLTRRSRLIPASCAPLAMTGMAMVCLAMVLLMIGLAAPPVEQLLRLAVAVVGAYGFYSLATNRRPGRPDGG